METVNDLYIRSLALYDEISKSGTVNASKTADYKARTPFLADILQKELWNTGDYTKIFDINYVSTGKRQKITLPTDFLEIKKVIIEDENDNYINYNGYEIEKNGIEHFIYINLKQDYIVKVHYKPYPITITSIDNYIELDAITSVGIAYGLCRYFAMSEQNEFVENICNAKFNEIKNNKVRVPAHIEQIIDIYRVGE